MRASSSEVADTLLNVAQTMISKLDLAELMPLILEQLATLVQFTSASIMLIEDDSLRLVARKSALDIGDPPFVTKLGSLAHVQHVIQQGEPLIIDDTRADARWLPRRANDAIRSWLGVPLLVKGQVIGLLNVSATTVAHFNQSDVDILRTFAAFAAITLDNARLYAEAQQARAVAEQAARAKTAFLANMSHEIRTPMTAVIGAASLLRGTEMTPEQQEYVDTIHICGDNLLSVINEILDFSKFEAGQNILEAEPFSLRECMEDAIAIVGASALAKGIEIGYRISPAAPDTVVGDQVRLRQILVNLLGNAVKFTEQGEVTVTVDVSAESPTVDPAACTLRFGVQDSGIGIPRDQLSALFEPFTQVDTTRARKYGGTGLGLAISKRLVQLMNGSISVSSEWGTGSTFTFDVQVGTVPAHAAAHRSETTAFSGQRALLVAKDTRSRAFLLEQLQSLGLQAAALDALPDPRSANGSGADAPGVLLLDSNLLRAEVQRGGAASAAQLAAMWPQRILLLDPVSGMSEWAQQHGFQHYLPKPVKRKALIKALANVLLTQRAPVETAGSTAAGAEAAGVTNIPHGQNGYNGQNGHDPAAAPLRVLLAEDNLDNQRLIARMVKKLGHEVDLVANGRQAAEAASAKFYDVVLMDLHMPELDGLEATRLIRQQPHGRRPHIVALTADTLPETRQACRAVGMDASLCKPLMFEQLARMLRKLA